MTKKIPSASPELSNDQLKIELKRIANDDLRRILPGLLRELKTIYEYEPGKKNPLAAWHAIYYCTSCGESLPSWVTGYLGQSAENLMRVGESHRLAKTSKKTKLDEKLAGKITPHEIKQGKVPVLIARALGLLPMGPHHVFNRFANSEVKLSNIDAIRALLIEGQVTTAEDAFALLASRYRRDADRNKEARAVPHLRKLWQSFRRKVVSQFEFDRR